MKLNTIAIIQARLNSRRLPNKMKKKIDKFRVIEWVVRRVKKTKGIDKIILATTRLKRDDYFEKIALKNKIDIFRGSSNDVLSRFYNASKKYRCDKILRICADNPFVDSIFLNDLIKKFNSKKYDYGFNDRSKLNYKCVDGFGGEIFSFKILSKIYKKVKSAYLREHVTLEFLKNKKKYKIKFIKAPKKYLINNKKFDINTLSDFEKIKLFVKNNKININTPAYKILSYKN